MYASDVVLPWERAQDFQELLDGLRLDFKPNGKTEDEIVFEIADLHWKKRRLKLQTSSAEAIEKSGKRSVAGLRRVLKREQADQARQAEQFAAGLASLSEAMTSLSEAVTSKAVEGKVMANLRSALRTVEELRPHIEAAAKIADATGQHDTTFNSGWGFDAITRAYEIEDRLDALIEKKSKRLILMREFQRQYGPDAGIKLVEHLPTGPKNFAGAAAAEVTNDKGRLGPRKKSGAKIRNANNSDESDKDHDQEAWEQEHLAQT